MKVSVLPIKGYRAMRVLKAFKTLLNADSMLPENWVNDKWDPVKHAKTFEKKTLVEKENVLRRILPFTNLEDDELDAILGYAVDPNGIPYSDCNRDNLKPEELFEVIIAVMMEIGKIEIKLVSDEEKKN